MAETMHTRLVDMSGMKWGRWYIVDVAFSEHNPIHRAIATDFREGRFADLIGSYEDTIISHFDLRRLSYFKVVREIPEMKEQPEFPMSADAHKATGA